LEGLEISEIKLSDVMKDNLTQRFDADYFKKCFLQDEKILKDIGFARLKSFASIGGGKRLPLGSAFSDVGVPYIRAEDVKGSFVEWDSSPKISENLHLLLHRYQAKHNDVLLTIVGNSIGDVGIVKFDTKCNLTENCVRVVSKDVLPEYLFCYLKSKFGQNTIERERVGTAQPKLAIERIKEFKLPKPSKAFQEKTKNILENSLQFKKESKQLYIKAEALLLKSLGLYHSPLEGESKQSLIASEGGRNLKTNSDFNSLASFSDPSPNAKRSTLPQGEGDGTEIGSRSSNNRDLITLPLREGRFATQNGEGLSFDVGNPDEANKFSHLSINQKSFKESFRKTGRLDAEYYQPKYEKIIEIVKSYKNGFCKLEDLIKNYSTGFPYKSESYVDEGLLLIRINNIKKGELDISNATKIPFIDENLSPKDVANENDILISMSGTIGNSCKIPKGVTALVNQRIMRITTKNFDVDVLPLIINSMIGQLQLERIGTGGVQTNISAGDIKEILLPNLYQKTQSQISSLIQESFALKAKSEKLLEVAKKAVEMAIEDSEEKAIKYLEKTDF
jgi:restriction endonuclease S subunit